MAQTLLIGLGGTGSRVVNNVVKELYRNNQTINNGEMCCAVFDTNSNDNRSIRNSATGVPVFATSKAAKIRDYLEDYAHLHLEEWCPVSPALLEQSMIDGASELRLKSRIAFMDCVEDEVMFRFENMINEVLKNGIGSKIRIMIVSSLAGGTGAGMFIQMALWLRKTLSQSEITIRGIFLLPDVFIRTLKDVRDNKTTSVRHYCNAYAAIRELNTITKIAKNNTLQLTEPIKITGLFDSDEDADSGKPVYDFAFFVDEKDENGIPLKSLDEYEKMVAQLVYMQLYAPMRDDMYSEEDNAFLSYVENDEPLYGSCGTAKAEYPRESVKTYCALRAAKDSLTNGWRNIDDEIQAKKDELEQRRQSGEFVEEVIDERQSYIDLFEQKKSVPEAKSGSDRFFLSIAHDVENEELVHSESSDGTETTVAYTDKVIDFMDDLSGEINSCSASRGRLHGLDLVASKFAEAKHTEADMVKQQSNLEKNIEFAIEDFKKNLDKYANSIVDSVFPYSMGEVNPSNLSSIYGLLTKKEHGKNEWKFIHPVAARYVLYKLLNVMNEDLKTASAKAKAYSPKPSDADLSRLYNNKKTKTKEEKNWNELFASRKWYQDFDVFMDEVEIRYVEFANEQLRIAKDYQSNLLHEKVYDKIIKRIEELVQQFESFFKNLEKLKVKLDKDIAKNVAETCGIVGKTMYVYGDLKSKEHTYRQLNFTSSKKESQINKEVLDTLYGGLCAKKRPKMEANFKYKNVGVIGLFTAKLVNTFREEIQDNKDNSAIVNIDIYNAVCRESDASLEEAQKAKERRQIVEGIPQEDHDFDNVNYEAGTADVSENNEARYAAAFAALKDKLLGLAAPLLIHTKEISKNDLGTKTAREKTFWGFSPEVKNAYPDLGELLRINADLQADEAYSQNELYCYRAVYGMEAKYIPKFNELTNGMYYKSYTHVIDEMVVASEGRKGATALVSTPHLDKNWHRTLPYVTVDKQEQAELEFFHGFWLAIAYGVLKTDKDGKYVVKRKVSGGFGNSIEKDIPVEFEGKRLGKTDVAKLLQALQLDRVFNGTDIPALEAKFKAELKKMSTYEGTKVLQGLKTSSDLLNPISLVCRYYAALDNEIIVTAKLIGALEKIASELAENYKLARTGESVEGAKYSVCRKIYDASGRSKGKSEVFKTWEEAFEHFKIAPEAKATKKTTKAKANTKAKTKK